MPYKTFGDFITLDQLKNTYAGINTIVSAKVNNLQNNKSKFVSNAEDFKNNAPFVAAANAGAAKIKETIAAQEAQKTKLATDLQSAESGLATLQKKAQEAYAAYQAAQAAYQAQQATVASLSNNLNAVSDNIKTAQDGLTDVAATKAKYDGIKADITKKLDAGAAAMKLQAPNQGAHIDAALTQAKAANVDGVKTNLNKFRPL